MAITGESAAALTDGNVQDETQFQIKIFPDDYPGTNGTTVKGKTMARMGVPIVRSDGLPGGVRWSQWVNLVDGNAGLLGGDDAVLYPILKKMYDAGVTALGL